MDSDDTFDTELSLLLLLFILRLSAPPSSKGKQVEVIVAP